jgi:hypothetical protein
MTFILGVVVGGFIGIFTMALVVMGRRDDK